LYSLYYVLAVCLVVVVVVDHVGLVVVVVVDDVGLVHEENVRKMQVLTFVQIAEGKSELSFETIERELQLAPDDVEAFIIDGIEVELKMFYPT